ncbi:MAG: hypothetical protein WCP26_13065 [Actinomycetes bacterium]
MATTGPARTGRNARYILGGAALLAMSGLGLGSLASAALFTDSKSTSSATVSSGTIALTLGQSASSGGLAQASIMPGDTVYTKSSVQNSGTVGARVSATANWSTANTFTSELQLSMVTLVNAASTCDATVDFTAPLNSATTSKTVSNVALTSNVATITTSAAHGLVIGQPVTISGLTAGTALNGSYLVATVPTTTTFTVAKTNANITSAASSGTVTIPTVSAASTSLTLYGDATTGQQTGDRTLAASTTEYYCIKMSLPLASTQNGSTSNLTLNFAAEQTTNNP